MINTLAWFALHGVLIYVIVYLTNKASPKAPVAVRLRLLLGVAISTIPPLGWAQWVVLRNRHPAYAESCMLQSLAGVAYFLIGAYGLGII